MNAAEALHHAARRYCVEHAQRWREAYSELLQREAAERSRTGQREPVVYGYSPKALRTFPRYNVLDAILGAVERLAPESPGDLKRARSVLAEAGAAAQSPFTQGAGEVEGVVMREERQRFIAFVKEVAEEDLARVEPLPLRRRLSDAEERQLRATLAEQWGVGDDYWFPIDRAPDAPPPPHTTAFDAEPFFDVDLQARLRRVIGLLGQSRLFQLDEDRLASAEIELDLFEPVYDGSEKFWMPGDAGWLVYASHEASLTVAGAPLLDALQREWPEWAKAVYSA